MMIVCDKKKLSSIVQKLKAVSARKFNIEMWLSISNKELNVYSNSPSSSKGACSLVNGRGVAQNHLWAQKYNFNIIDVV